MKSFFELPVKLLRIEDMTLPSKTLLYRSRADSFTGLAELAESLGRPLEPMLRRHGFTPETLKDPEAIISYTDLCSLIETCAVEWNCPDFGLRLARIQNLNILGPVGLVARLCDTVGEALLAMADRMAIHSTGFDALLDPGDAQRGRAASITYAPKPGSGAGAQMVELGVGITKNVLATASGVPNFKPWRVGFQHAAPADTEPANRFFGGPVSYGEATNTLYFDPGVLALPTAIRDKVYEPIIRAYLEQMKPRIEQDIVATTRELIGKLLATGRCSREAIAECLHLHPRTLQRRLAEHGVTFNELLDDYRKTLALDLLKQRGMPLVRIADTLGYADQSSFHQAFKRWTDTSPIKLRKTSADQR